MLHVLVTFSSVDENGNMVAKSLEDFMEMSTMVEGYITPQNAAELFKTLLLEFELHEVYGISDTASVVSAQTSQELAMGQDYE